jgi:hypothetical protein
MSTLPKTELVSRLRASRQAVEAGQGAIFLYVPDTQGVAAGSVIEIYHLAQAFQTQGRSATLIVEEETYEAPHYLDEELRALPHAAINAGNLILRPEDTLVIPEYFTSIIAKSATFPCARVVLVQGYDNALVTMVPGTTWADYGIEDIWCMSTPLASWVQETFGRHYRISTLRVGIPEYFSPQPVRDPVVAVQVRNPLDLKKIAHEFYLRYPELRWVGFEPLQGLTRRQYADLLARASICLWVDRIAAFGQTAVEAMACSTPLVALVPDHTPEYLLNAGTQNGLWVTSFADIVPILGKAIKAQFNSKIPGDIIRGMAYTAEEYTLERAREDAKYALEATEQARIEKFTLYLDQYEVPAE